jgi:hypothetical protein
VRGADLIGRDDAVRARAPQLVFRVIDSTRAMMKRIRPHDARGQHVKTFSASGADGRDEPAGAVNAGFREHLFPARVRLERQPALAVASRTRSGIALDDAIGTPC